MRELVLGVGHKREKHLWQKDMDDQYVNPVFTDIDPGAKPDVLLDLNSPLPFASDTFDEIHAYEVLEHIGTQGDWRGFFREFTEYWRVLKHGGLLMGHVPWWESKWAWGDPGHSRVIQAETLNFLAQAHYRQVGRTESTDYRNFYKGDLVPTLLQHKLDDDGGPGHLFFVLQANKEPGDSTPGSAD